MEAVFLLGLKRRILDDMQGNKIQYLLLIFFLVVGITAGTFTVSHMEAGQKNALTQYVDQVFLAVQTQEIDYFSIFIHAFLQDTLLFGTISLFSLVMIGIPVIAAAVIVKGFFVGFTVGVLAINFGFGGFGAIVFCTFIPNIILIPCVCKAGELGFNNSISLFKTRRIPSTTRDRIVSSKPHIIKIFKVYLVSFLGVLLETLLTPALIKLL
jgi:stage II sporulation protein M